MSDSFSGGGNEIPPPHKNYMWALCQSTINAQFASGEMMASDSVLAQYLSTAMDALSKAYYGDPNGSYSFTSNPDDFSGHTFEWYIKEMQDGAGDPGKSAWNHGKDDNEQPMMMQLLQQEYSIQNTLMQENVNVINGAQQGASNQSQSDSSNLQSLNTLASTGNTSATYAANLEQQTM